MTEPEAGQDEATTSESLLENSQPRQRRVTFIQRLGRFQISGYVIVFLSCLAFTLAGVFVKILTDTDPLVITGYRNCIIFLCSAARIAIFKINPEPVGKRRYLILRSLFLIVYSSTLFYAFRYLPLGDVMTLTAIQPLFVTFVACILLRESCGFFDIVALLSTLVGIVLVTHPPFLFGTSHGTDHDWQYYIAVIALLIGTVCQSIGFIIVRHIKDLDFAVITAWMGLISFIPPLILSWLMGSFSLPSLQDTPYVLAVGVLSFIGQSLMTVALQLQQAGIVSMVRKADDILVAFAIQILYFKNVPDTLAIIGSVIITITVIVVGSRKIVATKRVPSFFYWILCLPTPTTTTASASSTTAEA